MPVYLGVHNMGQALNEEEFKASWTKYKEECAKRGAEAHKVYYNAEAGRGFCVTEANSADDVRAAHEEVGVPVDELVEVQKLK